MNTKEAFNDTMILIASRTNDNYFEEVILKRLDFLDDSLKWPHLKEMWNKITDDNNPQGGTFSEGKLNRWLGWVQASGVALGVLTLDECKEINKRWSDGR